MEKYKKLIEKQKELIKLLRGSRCYEVWSKCLRIESEIYDIEKEIEKEIEEEEKKKEPDKICPKCNSSNIMCIIGWMHHDMYKCYECQHKWSKKL